MTRFRRNLAALLITALAALAFSSSSASAATGCTSSMDPITRYVDSGFQVMAFNARLSNCTANVTGVRFVYSGSGFQDNTGGVTFHQGYLNGTTSDQTYTTGPFTNRTAAVAQTCWYGAGVMHVLTTKFYWQYRTSAGWSTLNGIAGGPLQGITC